MEEVSAMTTEGKRALITAVRRVVFAGLLLAPSVSFTLEMAAIILILLASYLGSLSKAASGLRQYGGVMGKADPMAWCTADVCRYPSDAMSRLLTRKKGARKQW